MQVEVNTNKEFSHGVYSDLSRRNATDIHVDEKNEEYNITAIVPLAKLGHYSSDIRRITSGNATFTIQFNSYEQISQREYQELLEKRV
jgi:elongation factor G